MIAACLLCLASAVRADEHAAPIRGDAGTFHAVAWPRPWRWFSLPKKPQVNRAPRHAPPVVSSVVLAGMLGGGLALWLLLRLIRRKIGAGCVETPASLGTMFGFPAGWWIYDKLYPFNRVP
jgi:hypothetical protein